MLAELVVDKAFDDCDFLVSGQLAGLMPEYSVLVGGVLRNVSC